MKEHDADFPFHPPLTRDSLREVSEIEARARAVPGEHSIEEHGKGWVLYSGRKHMGKELFGHPMLAEHGLNLLYLMEPDRHWPQLKRFLENAHRDILKLIEHHRDTIVALSTAKADLTIIGELCGMTEGEHPLQAVERVVREHREMQRKLKT